MFEREHHRRIATLLESLDAQVLLDHACVDLTATKLMANADRWADDAVMSRDLIDLAMLAGQDGSLSAEAAAKARKAYGSSIDLAFAKARQHLLDRPQRLKICRRALGMTMRETALRRRIVRLELPAA